MSRNPPDSVSIVSGPQTFAGTITSLTSTVSCPYTLPVSAVSGSLQHSGSVAVNVQGGAAPFATPSWGSLVGVTQGSSLQGPSSASRFLEDRIRLIPNIQLLPN